ncbi:hypothetical protein [Nocardiopsis sp. NPDC057823]|uniref:hypothetical protein n=1 Tax=Nocardiopsis sp. NPDC057823 TaxID=3346256 RepID=UPI00366C9466
MTTRTAPVGDRATSPAADAATTLDRIGETLRRSEDLHWSDPGFLAWEREQVGDIESVTVIRDRNVRTVRYEAPTDAWDEEDGHHIRPMIQEIHIDRPTRPMIIRTRDYSPGVDTSGPLMLGPEPEAVLGEHDGEEGITLAGVVTPLREGAGIRGIGAHHVMCTFDETARFTPDAVRQLQRVLDDRGHATGRMTFTVNPNHAEAFRANLQAAFGEAAERVSEGFERLAPAFATATRAVRHVYAAHRSDFALVPGWDPGAPVDPRTVEITNASREVLLDWRDRRPRPWTAYTAGPQHQPRRHHRRGPDPRTVSATIVPRRAGRRP